MAPARTAAPRPLRTPTAPRIPRTLTPAAGSDLALAHDGKYLSLEYGPATVAGLEHEDAEDVEFDRCRFSKTTLAGVRLTGARFADVAFDGCNLSEANFQSAELTNVRFEGCKLAAAQFSNATMRQVRFAGGNDLAGTSGVQSLSGAIVSSADAPGLLGALASTLGITIED